VSAVITGAFKNNAVAIIMLSGSLIAYFLLILIVVYLMKGLISIITHSSKKELMVLLAFSFITQNLKLSNK
jgi:surface polysaccharide O-acyltransferase-like enzyme